MDGRKKEFYRHSLKKILSRLSDEEKIHKSLKISLALKNLLRNLQENHQLYTLGVYAPLPEEVVWNHHLLQFESYSSLSFPTRLVDQKTMEFRQCGIDELILSSAFGRPIFCPPEKAPVVVPEVLLIPGLGFSRNGTRMGRGKGYYDQYLQHYQGKKWGLCFEEQIVDELPSESHDVPMDKIVTDKNVYECMSV